MSEAERPDSRPIDEDSGDAPTETFQLGKIGHYQLVAKLGEGGMGVVYKAVHDKLKKLVAIKVLPNDRLQNEQAVARFQREMEAVGRLQHPNLVQATDAGEADDKHFLVMECVDGIDLSKMVKRGGPLPVADACELIRQTALGLEYAHQNDLVHRDIKPSNLILATDGYVKILDFGLALLHDDLPADAKTTSAGFTLGTVDYMAPEQASDSHAVDIRADIYSLGCALYQLLVGKAPFVSSKYRTIVDKLAAHARDQPPPIDDTRIDVPPEVCRIVEQMLAKDPDDRFASPADVAHALESFTTDCDLPELLKKAGQAPKQRLEGGPKTGSTEPARAAATLDADVAEKINKQLAAWRWMIPLALAALILIAIVVSVGVFHGNNDDENTNPEVVVHTPEGDVVRVGAGGSVEIVPVSRVALVSNPDAIKGARSWTIETKGPRGEVHAVAYSPDGKLLATGSEDGTSRIVETKTGSFVKALVGHDDAVQDLSWSHDSQRLASGGRDNTVRMWDVPSGQQTHKIDVANPTGSRVLVAYSPDGKFLAYGDGAGKVHLWDTATEKVLRILDSSPAGLRSLVWSKDGQQLAVAGRDNQAQLFDAATGEKKKTFQTEAGTLTDIAISPTGELLATVNSSPTEKTTTCLWDVVSGEVRRRLPAHLHGTQCVAFSDDGKIVITGGHNGDGRLRAFNVQTGEIIYELGGDETKHRIGNIAVSADGQRLAVAYQDGMVQVRDLQTGRPLKVLPRSPLPRVSADGHVASSTSTASDVVYIVVSDAGQATLSQIKFRERYGRKNDSAKAPPPLAVAPFNATQAKQHQQAWADYLGVPVERDVDLPGGEKMTFVLIPPGEFLMGSSDEQRARFIEEAKATLVVDQIPSEGPQHDVRITRPFYLGKYEVTHAQWQSVMGDNPSRFKDTPTHPVEHVSWNDIQPFLAKLNKGAAAENKTFALPTEAQWEYTCRAGTKEARHFGDNKDDLQQYGWFQENSDDKSHSVGQFRPNAFGLYDMHGTVWEWCADWFGFDYYGESPSVDPGGPSFGSLRVLRGGSSRSLTLRRRSAFRGTGKPTDGPDDRGFRVVCELDSELLAGKVNVTKTDQPTATPPNDLALEFDGETSYVEFPTLKYDGTPPMTIEARVTVDRHESYFQHIITNYSKSPVGGMTLQLASNSRLMVHAHGDNPDPFVIWENPQSQRSFHVAVTYDATMLSLYVDGVRMESGHKKIYASEVPFRIASPVNKQPTFSGTIDEVRLSNNIRYTKDFTPAKRFQPDEHTLALYHFDEGQGDVLKDSSGNDHHGKIHGAKWVKAAPSPAVAPFNATQAKQHQQAWADYLGVPVEREVDLPGGEKITMILVPPGEFLMGSNDEQRARFIEEAKAANDPYAVDRNACQGPQHQVRLTRPFYLGKYEVTQAQWQSVMGDNPSKFKNNPTHPVEQVSWDDIQPFLVKLDRASEQKGMKFSLPTEAQWEYTCRGGTTTACSFGDNEDDAQQYGFFKRNSDDKPHPVGQLRPNAFGLYDLHGNVWEWCIDRYAEDYYAKSAMDDPSGSGTGTQRVNRGGGWSNLARDCRSAIRGHMEPGDSWHHLGFRLAMTVPSEGKRNDVTKTADPDRAAAEWVLGAGGSITTDAGKFTDVSQLPTKPFQVVTVDLRNNRHVSDTGMVHLKGLTQLTHLDLGFTQISDAGFEHLKGLTTLTELTVDNTQISDMGLVHLKGLTNLTFLWIGISDMDAGLEHLKGLTKLTKLCVYGVKGPGLVHLHGLTNLKELNLDFSQINDAGLVHLKGMTNLKTLHLSRNPVRELEHLGGMTNLTHLALKEARDVNDAGLENIKGLTNLTFLMLVGTQVSDAGLVHLKGMSKLRTLWLADTKVTDQGKADLQKALPDCVIR